MNLSLNPTSRVGCGPGRGLSVCLPSFSHGVELAGDTDVAAWSLAVTSFRHLEALFVN